MSWLSENYEKAALGGAIVLALGLGSAGFLAHQKVAESFNSELSGAGKNNAAVASAVSANIANNSRTLNHAWKKAEVEKRALDLFTSIPLFVKKSAPTEAIDLIKSTPIHADIPNQWWIENHIDPTAADVVKQDIDGDGFSNLEEFQAKTNPRDKNEYPSVLKKLTYLKEETLTWVILPGYPSSDGISFKYEDSAKATNKSKLEAMVKPGDLFFTDGAMKERFKFIGTEVKKVKNKYDTEEDVTFAKIEDQRPNKKGQVYEIPAPLTDRQKADHLHYDRTAVVTLEALGQEGKQFKLEENVTFALPATAANKAYKITKITPSTITIEHKKPSGESESTEIQKSK